MNSICKSGFSMVSVKRTRCWRVVVDVSFFRVRVAVPAVLLGIPSVLFFLVRGGACGRWRLGELEWWVFVRWLILRATVCFLWIDVCW